MSDDDQMDGASSKENLSSRYDDQRNWSRKKSQKRHVSTIFCPVKKMASTFSNTTNILKYHQHWIFCLTKQIAYNLTWDWNENNQQNFSPFKQYMDMGSNNEYRQRKYSKYNNNGYSVRNLFQFNWNPYC